MNKFTEQFMNFDQLIYNRFCNKADLNLFFTNLKRALSYKCINNLKSS